MITERANKPRGTEVMLPHGGLPEAIPPYLQKLIEATGGPDGPIGLQFWAQPDKESAHWEGDASDPLIEDEHEISPGLIYKYRAKFDVSGKLTYPGRGLFTPTLTCAAYCRFCTRGREVGVPSGHVLPGSTEPHTQHLSRAKIDETLEFIRQEPGLNEIIVSGGDPLTMKPEVLRYVLGQLGELQKSDKLKIVRIGTRLPVHNPLAFKEWHYEAIKQLRHPRLMIHVNHPAELTPETRAVLARLQEECGAKLHSQSVLLKGVNDNAEVLSELFQEFAYLGGSPYILYQNDPVYWAKHLTVPQEEAMEIFAKIRPNNSGIVATARYVIDTPQGYGKVAVPEGGSWDYDATRFRDFEGQEFDLR